MKAKTVTRSSSTPWRLWLPWPFSLTRPTSLSGISPTLPFRSRGWTTPSWTTLSWTAPAWTTPAWSKLQIRPLPRAFSTRKMSGCPSPSTSLKSPLAGLSRYSMPPMQLRVVDLSCHCRSEKSKIKTVLHLKFLFYFLWLTLFLNWITEENNNPFKNRNKVFYYDGWNWDKLHYHTRPFRRETQMQVWVFIKFNWVGNEKRSFKKPMRQKRVLAVKSLSFSCGFQKGISDFY